MDQPTFMDQPIGCIGLGLLGSALAGRLLQGGRHVVGYDPLVDRRTELRQAGGDAVESLNEVARQCRQFVLCLPDSRVVAEVVRQLRPSFPPGSTLIDTTTGDPQATGALGAELHEQAIDYLDATVAGSSDQARRGEVLLLVGGRAEVVQQTRPLLEILTTRIFHLGPWGSGARMKLVFNLVLGLNRAALAEGLSLAGACGLDLPGVLEVLRAGAARSEVMQSKGDKMLRRDFHPQARLVQHLKDVRLIQELGQRVEQPVPLTDVHRKLLERVVERGFGQEDNSAVIRAFEGYEAE